MILLRILRGVGDSRELIKAIIKERIFFDVW